MQQQDQQQSGATGSTKKRGKGKGGKGKGKQKPKTVIEYITPDDHHSAANAYRVLSDHLLEALDDMQALSGVGHPHHVAHHSKVRRPRPLSSHVFERPSSRLQR
jgi:hypothetical protein